MIVERILAFLYGALVCAILWTLASWYIQSRQLVILHISPPNVVAVTTDYVDVEWHNQRLLDCPTMGTPAFYTPLATEYLAARPVASGLVASRFVRRYHFPAHLRELHQKNAQPDIDYMAELQVHIEAKCNPLFTTQQLVRVPFRMTTFAY